MDILTVKKITNQEDLEKAFAIRKTVFVAEQHCPPELEYENEDVSIHFLASINDMSCGAARWRKTEVGYKLERFAVSKNYRGKGVGQALVAAVLADLPEDATYIYLNSQLNARGLYVKFGFIEVGPEFEEAGIKHFKMVKQ